MQVRTLGRYAPLSGPQRSQRGPYRHHTIEFKRAVVEQSLELGASVSRVARPHDLNANQICRRRKVIDAGQAR